VTDAMQPEGIKSDERGANTRPRQLVHWLSEPIVLFPLIAVTLITALWTITLSLIDIEHVSAEQSARISTQEIAGTYEAQLIRALREIEQALTLVQYMMDLDEPGAALNELSARALLPPDVLFVVTVTDAEGQPIASTRAFEATPSINMDALRAAIASDDMFVSPPRFDADNDTWWIDFSRLLFDSEGDINGAISVAADAAYFVSGYEPTQLGQRGLLGLIGNDGIYRVRRSGDTITYGTPSEMDGWLTELDPYDPEVSVFVHHADAEERYTSARSIFGFPLTFVLGLSTTEQHIAAQNNIRKYLWRTSAASLLLLALTGLLGAMSAKLQRSRAQTLEEQIAHARQVEYLAFHDGLTGLPNRSFFTKLLHQEILTARRNNAEFALMFLDIDKFKTINDSLGHDAGDQLLNEVAHRMRSALRESDVIARMGGDEFTILLPGNGDEADLLETSRKILSAVRKSYVLAGQEIRITVSIGASIYPHHGEDEETLMKFADIAMYHAKESGRNNFKFYSDELNSNSLEKLSLETSLRHAIERNQLTLYYQAKRDLITNNISGMEALLRWQHPDLGLIPPMQFIPLAEENGLIVPIGRWVLETACRQSVEWRHKGIDLGMAVNLSAMQFRDDNLLSDLGKILRDTDMNPRMLELEITESMIMSDLPRAIRIMDAMKAMGVRIAIDDFGTGYSSLSALKEFPVDTIKIDGSFISDIVANKESQGLADAIIAMGRTLGLTVVAEGVESEAQLTYLKSGSCDEFQGFYLNVPMPSKEFEDLLTSTEWNQRQPGSN
jgi:diguanylate cyclase (GGDEF)-like protein